MLKMFKTSLVYIERIDVFDLLYPSFVNRINKCKLEHFYYQQKFHNIFATNDGENYVAWSFTLTFSPISSMGIECLGDWLNIFEWG